MLATVGPSRTAAGCRPLVLAHQYLPRQSGLQPSRSAKFSYRFLISVGCPECASFRPASQVSSFRAVEAVANCFGASPVAGAFRPVSVIRHRLVDRRQSEVTHGGTGPQHAAARTWS